MAKKKERDVIEQLLDQIDFHGNDSRRISRRKRFTQKLTSRFYSRALDAEMDSLSG